MSSRTNASASGHLSSSKWPEVCLAFGGLLALGYCCAAHIVAQSSITAAARLQLHTDSVSSKRAAHEGVIGSIAIPQLHLSAPITAGVGTIELIRGVGHIPGTAFAGGLGTMVLAGHRDTFFRSLRNVAPGMTIAVSSEAGLFRYQVDSTEIVNPEQTSVMDIGSQPELVLITCHPFDYIGAAPRRFIVHAHLLSLAPEDQR